MTRTTKGSKGPGFDYWSRRHPYNACMSPSKGAKRKTIRRARRWAKAAVYYGDDTPNREPFGGQY